MLDAAPPTAGMHAGNSGADTLRRGASGAWGSDTRGAAQQHAQRKTQQITVCAHTAPCAALCGQTLSSAMRASLLLLALCALSAALASAQSCGTNGQCSTAAACPAWSTQSTSTGQCAEGLTCCQAPSCQSGSTVGVCKNINSCESGRTATGLCPGDNSIKCCLPAQTAPSCQGSTGAFGTCISTTSCATGNIESGLCPGDSTIQW